MTDLTLYYAIPSRGMTVNWLLEELGEPFERVVLSLEKEEHKQPEYLAINPLGRVPALRHGTQIITETAAICTYLAEAFPEADLGIAPGEPDRADYLRWLFFAPVTAEPSVLWKALGATVQALEYQPFVPVEEVAEVLRDALRDREFIAGDHFTAADVLIGSAIMWGTQLMPVLPQHPELLSYWERLAKREAWQRAQAHDNAFLTPPS